MLNFTIGHQVNCRCPEKFNGNPDILCSPVELPNIGCKSVTDCAPTESCINEHCVNPCNCGENSECFVQDHVPTCQCKSGFTGNPVSGCKKIGCQSDEECANDLTCYNGDKCINPCLIGNPCSLSANCYGNNHRAGNLESYIICESEYLNFPKLFFNQLVNVHRVLKEIRSNDVNASNAIQTQTAPQTTNVKTNAV